MKRYSKKEIQFIKENYHKMSAQELALKMDRPYYGIVDKALALGLGGGKRWVWEKRGRESRKFKFNYDYFSKINSHEKAYWYGFIWADGSVTNRNDLIISLHFKDLNLIETFRKHIKANYKISNNRQMRRICLTHPKLTKDLSKLNILPKKTYLDNLPILPKKYFSSWLLGFFDGDGYCGYGKLSFCCRPSLGIWIKDILDEYRIPSKIQTIKNKENINLEIYGIENIERLSYLMTFYIKFNLKRKAPRYRRRND